MIMSLIRLSFRSIQKICEKLVVTQCRYLRAKTIHGRHLWLASMASLGEENASSVHKFRDLSLLTLSRCCTGNARQDGRESVGVPM